MRPHRHAELIKAWADGAEIEWQASNGKWMLDKEPNWSYPDGRYRIKPEPKPDVIAYTTYEHWAEGQTARTNWQIISVEGTGNLKLTFDGESGKLKGAEVL